MERDEELFLRIRQGDLRAFDLLYERHRVGLFRFIRSYVRNTEEAEEVFHEAFLRTLQSRELEFESGGFRGWLYLVARNLCLNRIRSRRRGERASRELEPPEGAPNAESLLERHEIEAAVRIAKEKLPESLAEVLRLRLSGLANAEISRALGIPVGTVKSRFHSIVRFFKTEISR